MKRIFLPLAATAIAAFTFSCSDRGSHDADTSLLLDTIVYSDSLMTGTAFSTADISVVYPTGGNRRLADSVQAWIASLFETKSEDPRIMIKAEADSFLTEAKQEIGSLNSSFPDEPAFSYDYDRSITRIFVSDSVSTFGAMTYTYTGGAHGSTTADFASFAALTGERLGWNIFRADSLPMLPAMIRAGLAEQYFKVRIDSLGELLMLDSDNLPLPATAPWISEKGVNFTYQQYEIAPYYLGIPTCSISFADLRGLMTPEAYRLCTE